MPNFANIL